MRIGKIKMYLLLNGIIVLILLVYFGIWMTGNKVEGRITNNYLNATVMKVHYKVDGVLYTEDFLRNGIPFNQKKVTVRYLNDPSSARIDSFLGLWAEPIAWWGVFLLASSLLFLTNNVVFSKGTVFQFHKKFPWISMEEYFPVRTRWFWRKRSNKQHQSSEKNSETEKKSPKRLPE